MRCAGQILPSFAMLMFAASGSCQESARPVLAGCGPDKVSFHSSKGKTQPALAAEQDTALVYVISELRYGGIEIGCQAVTRVGLDGQWVGANCGSSYLSARVAAGEHHLCVDWHPHGIAAPLPALDGWTAEAGKTYYFRVKVLYVPGVAGLDLDPVNPDEGRLLVTSLPESVSRPKN